MLVLLSPSKTQDFDGKPPVETHTLPPLLEDSALLIVALRKLKPEALSKLMAVSNKLAELNHARYKKFTTPFTLKNAKQACFAFQGDVYDGLKAETLSEEALAFAQQNLRILSGLYGVLRPLDLIQPYRLEMKIRLANPRGKDLYAFWGDRITELLNQALEETHSSIVINLASQEYFKAVNQKLLRATVVTPQFREKGKNGYQMIALFAKQARGAMAHYIAAHSISNPEALHFFADDGYRWNAGLSKRNEPVFTRG